MVNVTLLIEELYGISINCEMHNDIISYDTNNNIYYANRVETFNANEKANNILKSSILSYKKRKLLSDKVRHTVTDKFFSYVLNEYFHGNNNIIIECMINDKHANIMFNGFQSQEINGDTILEFSIEWLT